jgi:hypothetical protein
VEEVGLNPHSSCYWVVIRPTRKMQLSSASLRAMLGIEKEPPVVFVGVSILLRVRWASMLMRVLLMLLAVQLW